MISNNLAKRDSTWFAQRNLDRTRCSLQDFFHENGDFCPKVDCLGPFDGYPNCEAKILRAIEAKDSNWFARRNLDGSRCSLQGYYSMPGEFG
jgi:hypothetical protein